MRNKFVWSAIQVVVSIALLSGCDTNTDGAAGKTGSQDAKEALAKDEGPVELTFYSHYLANFDDYFGKILGEMVRKKYPNITLTFIMGTDQGQTLDKLLAAGTPPDIIYAAQGNAPGFKDSYKAIEDLSPYIKANQLDLSKFEPSVMDAIKSYGDSGQIYGLPMVMSPWALYYNKDLFNKFGVSYPKDGMTWNEVSDLAAKLTRTDGGTKYKGIVLQMIDKMSLQLSLPYVDPKTLTANLETDGWKKLFAQMKKIWDIPGMFSDEKDISAYSSEFDGKKTAAMVPNNNKIPNYVKEEANGFNWDVVSFPSYPDKPNVYPAVEANTLMMDTASRHKDDVFKVIAYLVSDDVQLALAKTAQMSALNGDRFHQAFGESYPSLKSKNIQGIFKSRPAPLPTTTVYDDLGLKAVRDSWKDVLVSGKDINSALHEASDKLNKSIADAKAK